MFWTYRHIVCTDVTGGIFLRFLRWIMAALIVVYLIVSPAIIQRGLARDQYREWNTPEKPAWEGRIELWHIVSFKVYQGSVTRYLRERADAYAKAHPGVYMEVIGLTESQYESRVARGAFPDGYSFAAGLLYAEQLRAVAYELPDFRGTLRAAAAGGKTYAVPWMMSGYFLAANTQLLSKYRMELPERTDAAFLQEALSLGGGSPQLAMPFILAARAGLNGMPAEESAFTGGRSMLAVLDARSLGDILRGTGGNITVSALPYGDYTDQVQYIGAARQTDDMRAAIIADFIGFLLTDAEQERLSALGALPVTASAQPAYAENELAQLYAALQKPLTPDPFSYQRHREMLLEEAALALGGDGSAKNSFRTRMAVVESGEL